jgi:hypothetical protein
MEASMNSWSNEELARLLRPQQPTPAPEEPKPKRPVLTTVPPEPPVQPPPLRAVPAGPDAQPEAGPGSLSQQEIDALMRALNQGTQMRMRRQATPEELQRLIKAVTAARRLQLLATEAIFSGATVFWSGSDWVFERSPRHRRAA